MLNEQEGLKDPGQLKQCVECARMYDEEAYWQSNASYFDPPIDYSRGAERYCLACWLGVGPNDFPEMYSSP